MSKVGETFFIFLFFVSPEKNRVGPVNLWKCRYIVKGRCFSIFILHFYWEQKKPQKNKKQKKNRVGVWNRVGRVSGNTISFYALYSAVLHFCTLLCSTVLYILYSTLLCFTVLYNTVPFFTMLCCVKFLLCCTLLCYIVFCCAAPYYALPCCIVLC